jgi:hypothetical protein
MPKPKPYRKTKESKGSDMVKFKDNTGGGPVQGVIVGPETSVGTVATHPSVATGSK